MKSIEYYKSLPYCIEVYPDGNDGYAAVCPDLPGCSSTGATREAAISGIDTAMESWLVNALNKGIDIPEPDRLDDYSGQFKLRLPKSLHRQLAINAKKEGISMNQYCLYLLARNDALHCPMTLSTKQREIIAEGLHTPLEDCLPEEQVQW